MAVIKQGILGGVSGKVGSVVGTSWKGQAVLKAMPLSVANPQSPGQTAQRGKFSGIVNIAQFCLSSILQPVWNPFASKMSGYNMFVQKNVNSAFNDAGVFQSNALEISPKDGTTTAIDSASALNGREYVDVAHSIDLLGSDQMETDKAFVLVCNPSGFVLGSKEPSALRTSEEVRCHLSRPLVTGEIIHIYLAFISADKKRAFRTAHLAKTVTAS